MTLKPWSSLVIHAVLVLLCGAVTAALIGREAAVTLCAGGVVSLLTLVGVVWSIHRMMEKKPIALTTGSIVIKYALLGWILYYLTQTLKMDILWLGLGVFLILPSLIIFGLLSEKGLEEDGVE
jgi:hypothetical protein